MSYIAELIESSRAKRRVLNHLPMRWSQLLQFHWPFISIALFTALFPLHFYFHCTPHLQWHQDSCNLKGLEVKNGFSHMHELQPLQPLMA